MSGKSNQAAAKMGIGFGQSKDDEDEKSILGNEDSGFGMNDMDDKKPGPILPKSAPAKEEEPE
jgi:hypothetical protein